MAFFNTWYIKLQGESTSQDLSLWGVQTHVDAAIAKPKTSYQDVFGLNGSIDRSDIGTGVKYKNRTIKMYLVIRDEDIPAASGFENANEVYEAFARKYHGQRVEISRPTDSIGGNWQRYKGRLQVSKDSKTTVVRLVTCTIEADPFVYFDEGVKTVKPTYQEKTRVTISEASKVEDGGLRIFETLLDGRVNFLNGAVGRYAVWKFTVPSGAVFFPTTMGGGGYKTAEFTFLTPNDEEITFDNGGYYSASGGDYKVKITITATGGVLGVAVDVMSFVYNSTASSELYSISALKMPSDIYYTNQNDGAKIFLNGNIFDLEVNGAGKFDVLLSDQLAPNRTNWLAILTASASGASTASTVIINYDNRDLVGVPDV